MMVKIARNDEDVLTISAYGNSRNLEMMQLDRVNYPGIAMSV
jgi:hypothetical protein